MHQALITIATAIGGVIGFLALLIIAHKARLDRAARTREIRRRVLAPRVEAYLKGQHSGISEALGERISRQDRSVVEDILLHRILDAQGSEGDRLARALDELGFLGIYLKRLKRWRWWHRAEGAENLGLARAERARQALLQLLDDDNSEVRFRAARALGRIGNPSDTHALILTLNHPGRFSTISIANVLVSMGPGVCEIIMAYFEDLTPRARVVALDVLSAVGTVKNGPWLRERLKDANSDVRSRAAKGLGSIGDLMAGPLLVQALQDPEWPVRAVAAKSLAMLRYAPSVPELCNALRDSEWWVRANAAEALRELGQAGLTGLEAMLDDEDTYARHQAVFMLEESGVLDERVAELFDASNRRRAQSRSFVEQVIDSGQRGRLSDLSEGHADDQVRAFLARALERDVAVSRTRR